jgi:two-component system sensor histidine kinase DegS
MTTRSADKLMLDRIIQETLHAIEQSKEDIFDISESAKNEQRRYLSEIENIRHEVMRVIEQVDRLELMYKRARVRLMEVSKEFNRYSEADIKAAYDNAQKVQVQLAIEQEKEQSLRKRRDEIERSIANIEEIVKKADDLVSKVDLALTFLSGNLNHFNSQSWTAQQREWMGGRIILAQEEERRRVAREIHDGPAQTMANVVLRAEFCEKLIEANRPEIVQEIGELKNIVKDSLKEVRRIIFNLRPMTLDDLGIVPTLRRYAEEFKDREGIQTTVTVKGEDRRLAPSIEVTVFRLVQEALNNIKKHAKVDNADVILEFSDNRLQLRIIDTGQGFDSAKVHQEVSGKQSFGLLSMKERVELLNGDFELISSPGTGTTVMVTLPLEEGSAVG